jgi:cytidylate kinase
LNLIIAGSVVEVSGIPGAGKTTAVTNLKKSYQTSNADWLYKFFIWSITRFRIDRLALLLTGLRFWQILRYIDDENGPISTLFTLVGSPIRRRPDKQRLGHNVVVEILFLLNDINRRNIVARMASMITQKHCIVDEMWMQGMIGIWLRIPSEKRKLFWSKHVLKRNWRKVVLISVDETTIETRSASISARPIIRYSLTQTSGNTSDFEHLTELNKLLCSTVDSNQVVILTTDNAMVETVVQEQVLEITNSSRLAIYPRTRMSTKPEQVIH